MQIYWNKRKHLHKKRVQLPKDWVGTPTWLPFHCFGTPIWPPWRHVKTLLRHFSCASTLNILCTTCFNSVLRFFWFPEYRAELYWRLENKRMEKLSKENTPCNGDQTVDQNNNADNYKSKEVGEKVSKLKKWQGGRTNLSICKGKMLSNSDI